MVRIAVARYDTGAPPRLNGIGDGGTQAARGMSFRGDETAVKDLAAGKLRFASVIDPEFDGPVMGRLLDETGC